MIFNRWRRSAVLALAALTAMLTGCTSYVATQVTAFSDWSGSDANRTYAFARTPEQRNSIEETTYERIVADALAPYAFQRVDEKRAHYLVALSYATRTDMVSISQPVYYDPWPGPFWGGGPWGPWGPWGPFPAGYVNQSYPVYTHTLNLRITERSTGKEVYNVSARNANDDGALLPAMPYLVRSALADFPLGNGVVRTVKIPFERGGAGNETAAGPAAAPAPAIPAPAPAQ